MRFLLQVVAMMMMGNGADVEAVVVEFLQEKD